MRRMPVRARIVSIGFLLVLVSANALGDSFSHFKIASDPMNLPFSDRNLGGFENKIAELIGNELGVPPTYVWWGQRRGFIRNTFKATLEAGRCDVVMGVPKGYDLVDWTKPYYRSAYVFVYPKEKGYGIRSLDDPKLRDLRIGVHLLGNDYMNPPPVHALGKRGIVDNVIGFDTFYSETNPPGKIIEAVAEGQIDLAIVWGPIGGYFAKKQKVAMEIIPLPSSEGDLPFAFDICLGIRRDEKELKTRLEEVLFQKRAEITEILEDFGVPLLPLE